MARKGIMVHAELPERATAAERIAMMDSDMRDVTARLRAEVLEQASKYTVAGWALDEDSWEGALNGRHVVIVGHLERPD